MTPRRASLWCAAVMIGVLSASPLMARDAAFVSPGGTTNSDDEAVRVEPKADIDTGDSILSVPRRTTLFFVNESGMPVQVEKTAVNSDGNVTAEIVNDDCSKQGTIAPQSRCSIEISITPNQPGGWSVEALLTHNGAGRIARAKLTGKTSGAVQTNEKKEMDLALNAKEVKPVAFGDVEVGGKAVRSALMVNDSADPITLYSIDVIAADNGLQKLDQGCAVDMELKPGESCPVTLLWTPTAAGDISTDLIIRHSGHMGFAVIPIRGNVKGASASDVKTSDKSGDKNVPPPPTAAELERATSGKIPQITADTLAAAATPSGTLRLIGTVGVHAVLLLPNGTTAVAGAGDEIDLGDKKGKVLTVDPKAVEILVGEEKKTLTLGMAPELAAKAAAAATATTTGGQRDESKSAKRPMSQSAPLSAALPPSPMSAYPKMGGSP